MQYFVKPTIFNKNFILGAVWSVAFSPDGKYFFFSSTRAGNKDLNGDFIWDLYYIESKYLIIE